MKFDIKKKHLTKSKLARKLLSSYIVALMLMASFSLIFVATCEKVKGDEKLFTIPDSGGDTETTDTSTMVTSNSDAGNVADNSNAGGNSKDNAADKDDSVFWVRLKNYNDKNDNEAKVNGSDNSSYAPNERLVPVKEIVSMTEYEMENLSSEEEKEATLENSEETSICSVDFTAATNLKKVNVTVIKLKDKPEEIIEPPKKNISVYKYLDIKLTADDEYVEEDNIKSLKFKFKVEQTWITDNNIDKVTIILIRYHDGEWQNLSTTLTSEDETYIYYEAESPGCSTFAVVGSKVVEKGEAFETDEPEIPWIVIIGFIIAAIVTLLIVLFKARYIYLGEDFKEGKEVIK